MLTNYDFYCKQSKHIWEVSAYTAYNDFRIILFFFTTYRKLLFPNKKKANYYSLAQRETGPVPLIENCD